LENRPNSSVSDFRDQLSSLQRAVPSSRTVSMRPMARPLAPSAMARPPATGRPPLRSGVTIAGGGNVRSAGQQAAMRPDYDVRPHDPTGRGRTHGSVHGEAGTRSHARPAAAAPGPVDVKRRRANVLFVLVVVAACAIFLAVTTKSPGMTYAAVGAGIAVVAYLMVLAQAAMSAAPARTRRATAPASRQHGRTAREAPRPARRAPAEPRYRGERAAREVVDQDERSSQRPAARERAPRPAVYGDPLRPAPVADLDEWAATRVEPARRREHQPAASRVERTPRPPRQARPARPARHRSPAAEWSQDPRPSGQMWGDPLFA
jgi:hypothetical protein